jgi:flagellar biosynthetic protein FlhB
MPIMLALTATAMLATVAQVGLNFTLKPLVPKLSKLSMTKGIKNMTDTRAAVRFGMSMGKLAIVVGLAGMIIVHDLPAILSMASLEVLPMVGIAAQLVFGLSLKLSALLLVLAILDYSFQKWHRMSELRMSKHEVKEEMRSMEGDPLVKQRRARVARQLAMQRMGQAVPKADVIVTNPTHFAVALQYHSGDMKAPKVIAKGADFMAMRIRQIGVAHGVPIVERKELARSLYRHVEIGHEIPPEFYGAVAEILAYVYRLSGRRSA